MTRRLAFGLEVASSLNERNQAKEPRSIVRSRRDWKLCHTFTELAGHCRFSEIGRQVQSGLRQKQLSSRILGSSLPQTIGQKAVGPTETLRDPLSVRVDLKEVQLGEIQFGDGQS